MVDSARAQSIEPLLSITGVNGVKASELGAKIAELEDKLEKVSRAQSIEQSFRIDAERKLEALDKRSKNAIILDEMWVDTADGLIVPDPEQGKALIRMAVNGMLREMLGKQKLENRNDKT